jgi:PBP1b-binding outer membrane lipoprotein LpoB
MVTGAVAARARRCVANGHREEKTMIRRILQAVGLGALALTIGCAGVSVKTYSKPGAEQRQYGKVKKIAVLPFDSLAEGAAVPKVVQDLFLVELMVRGTFETVEEPRFVAALMKKLKLRNTEELDREVVRKIGEELKAEAIILGNVWTYGTQKESEVVEFAMRSTMLDAETGSILWSGETYVKSATSWAEVLGLAKAPSPSDIGVQGVRALVAFLDRDFRDARESEVERMLEAAKAESLDGGAPPAEEAAPGAAPPPPKEQEGEEILLQVKPK